MSKMIKILLGLFLILFLASSFYPKWLIPFDAAFSDASHTLKPPNQTHWLGTDELGRDVLARLLQASKYSLSLALCATAVSAIFGFLIGSFSALGGRFIDSLLMRLMDLFLGIPDLLVYIILGIFLGQSPTGLIIALSLFGWISLARLVRFRILEEKNKDYILAANMLGNSQLHNLFKHILPNIWPLYFQTLLLKIPSFILAEATLSFLGLGLKSPLASLGTMAAEGYAALRFYPHLTIPPLITMVIFVLGLNFLFRRARS